jgi:hypothetical protein
MKRSVISIALLLAACTAGGRAEGPAAVTAELPGVMETVPLSADLYELRVQDGTLTPRMRDYVDLRASELALSRGYSGFELLPPANRTAETETNSALPNEVLPGFAVRVRLLRYGGEDAREVNRRLAPAFHVASIAGIDRLAPPATWRELEQQGKLP